MVAERPVRSCVRLSLVFLAGSGCGQSQSPPGDQMRLAASASSLHLRWVDNATNEAGFELQRRLGRDGRWHELARLAADVVEYRDNDLRSGSQYCYRLRAFNAVGNSAWTNSACARFAAQGAVDGGPPSVVAGAADAGGGSIQTGSRSNRASGGCRFERGSEFDLVCLLLVLLALSPRCRRLRITVFVLVPLLLRFAEVQAAELEVGPGKAYDRLEAAYAAAEAGDVILVYPRGSGVAYQRVALYVRKANITFRGVSADGSRVRLSGEGFDYNGVGSTPRAMFQFNPGADGGVVENFEIFDCRNASDNGAAVRINQANRITLRNLDIHRNDMGVMSNGSLSANSGAQQLIDACAIHENGSNNRPGFNHNLYLGGSSVTVRGSEIYGSTTGSNLKSRAHLTFVEACYIHDSSNRELDLVDSAQDTTVAGSHALVAGSVIVKASNMSGNKTVIHFGQDGSADHDGTLYVVHSTIVTPYLSPVVDLSSVNAGVHLVNSLIVDPGDATSGRALVAASRNGASLARSSGRRLWLSRGFSVPSAGRFSELFVAAAGQLPPFVNAAAGNYALAQAASNVTDVALDRAQLGLPEGLASRSLREFVLPIGSRLRPVGGAVADLGAYEFAATTLSPPAAPSNLRVD